MVNKKDLKSQQNEVKPIDKYIMNPYPRAAEAKFNQNAVENILFGNKKENGDDENGKLSN